MTEVPPPKGYAPGCVKAACHTFERIYLPLFWNPQTAARHRSESAQRHKELEEEERRRRVDELRRKILEAQAAITQQAGEDEEPDEDATPEQREAHKKARAEARRAAALIHGPFAVWLCRPGCVFVPHFRLHVQFFLFRFRIFFTCSC